MLNPKTFLFMGAGLLFGLISCNSGSTESTEAPKEAFDLASARTAIDAGNTRFSSALKAGDSAGMAANYSSDAKLMPPNGPVVDAPDIASFWGGLIRAGVKDAKLTIDELTGDEHMLAETGHVEIYGDNNALIDEAKYVVVWKNVDGNWKMYRDIWSSINPPPPVK